MYRRWGLLKEPGVAGRLRPPQTAMTFPLSSGSSSTLDEHTGRGRETGGKGRGILFFEVCCGGAAQ